MLLAGGVVGGFLVLPALGHVIVSGHVGSLLILFPGCDGFLYHIFFRTGIAVICGFPPHSTLLIRIPRNFE